MSGLDFDTHQFEGRARPVSAEFDGHDFQSNGISWQDYGSMHTETHKLAPGRQLAAPEWVFNDLKLRSVIVGCVEARAINGFGKRNYDYTGTDAERLARAQKKLSVFRLALEARIDRLCKAYVAAKNSGQAAAIELAQKVQEVDTQLRLIDNPALYYVGVAYHYWRCGLNSVETAAQLGILPPHVRCLLWRMGKVAGELGYAAPKTITHRPGTKTYARHILKTATDRKQVAEAVSMLDPHIRQQKRNTKLIPYADRLPLVVKMYREGAKPTQIAAALGWGRNAKGNQEGCGMVKRLAVQAGLRKP